MSFFDNHVDLVMETLKREPWVITSTQYIVSGLVWEIPGEIWNAEPDVDMSYYAFDNKRKLAQLINNYYNGPDIEMANEKIVQRMGKNEDYTSTGWSMVGAEKKRSRQGHCIRAGTVGFLKRRRNETEFGVNFDIFYRMVELSRRFPTDFLFLRDYLIPRLMEGADYRIDRVRFHFSTAAVHVHMIMPLLGLVESFTEFCDEIKDICPPFHRMIIMHLARMYRIQDPANTYAYYSSMQRPLDVFIEYMEEYGLVDEVRGYFEENEYLMKRKKSQ